MRELDDRVLKAIASAGRPIGPRTVAARLFTRRTRSSTPADRVPFRGDVRRVSESFARLAAAGWIVKATPADDPRQYYRVA